MAKTATETSTKTATRAANNKTKPTKDAAEKPKREPSAYQVFCKERMKQWNEENPGRAKEAMAHIAAMWRDAPENPNRGQQPKARKPKEPKEPKPAKEPKAPKEPKAKAPKAAKPAKEAKEPKPKASRAKKPKKEEEPIEDEGFDSDEGSLDGSD